jgi:hypothetical protein
MTFNIHNSDTGDYFTIEAETLEEIQGIAKSEVKRRGWINYYSTREDETKVKFPENTIIEQNYGITLFN